MALDVYFRPDIEHTLTSTAMASLLAAAASGSPNLEYCRGVLDKLRPVGPQPKALTREWVQYTILHDAYVLGELNRDIMAKLYISESSFNRARRRAVRGVARAVQELERAALGSS